MTENRYCEPSREELEKLARLRLLAAEGFDEIDQGRGIELRGVDALCEFIAGIGQRVERQARSRRRSG